MSDNNIISLRRTACTNCSRVDPTIYDDDRTFKDTLIDQTDFTEELCEGFGRKPIFSLDVCLPYTSFVDVETTRSQKYLYFNAKKNPKNVFKGFLSILVRGYLNSFFSICDESVLGRGNVMFFRKSI